MLSDCCSDSVSEIEWYERTYPAYADLTEKIRKTKLDLLLLGMRAANAVSAQQAMAIRKTALAHANEVPPHEFSRVVADAFREICGEQYATGIVAFDLAGQLA
jgi:hypothetical protein